MSKEDCIHYIVCKFNDPKLSICKDTCGYYVQDIKPFYPSKCYCKYDGELLIEQCDYCKEYDL